MRHARVRRSLPELLSSPLLSRKLHHRLMRRRRIRAKVQGTAERPRLSVYRSLTNMYAQLIDDEVGKTLVAGSLKDLRPRGAKGPLRGAKAPARRSPAKQSEGGKKLSTESAAKLGKVIAEKAKKKKIGKVVFDRNAYRYHGRVKALAEAAREGGLQF